MSFDALAPHYRWMEFILAGNKLQRCRTAFLSEVSDCGRVLMAGEGNGRFLAECRRRMEKATITCLDASSGMLAQARNRIKNGGLSLAKIEFVQADALAWKPPERAFDLVVTHFFLDCFPADQLRHIVSVLAGAATADATWLVSDFQVPAEGLRRYRALLVHRAMYLFFALATRLPARRLTNPDDFLRANGFALRKRRVSEWGLLHTDKWERRDG